MTHSPEPSPEPTPAPSPPQPTAAMQIADPAGAEAAAAYFIELFLYTMESGDTGPWDRASDPACDFCRASSEEATSIRTSDQRYVDLGLTVTDVGLIRFEDAVGTFLVEVAYDSRGVEIRSEQGEVVDTRAEGSAFLALEIGYLPGDGWHLVGAQRLSESVR
ncbi:DUF6318 family protein [Cellulomonas carbonis]|uniref:DUF6318 family protein n=1 Tax=Cellulomonas carbonis TaxID=1386092 RepID=UPI00126A0D19|nr:DUF6318 family protein [Cellulomonas carbonis]